MAKQGTSRLKAFQVGPGEPFEDRLNHPANSLIAHEQRGVLRAEFRDHICHEQRGPRRVTKLPIIPS